jgi:hypothetical protein
MSSTELFKEQARGSLALLDKRSGAQMEQQAPQMSPMQELQMQIVRTGDLEKLKQLREIEKDWRDDQAKQAFNTAFAAFKAEAVKLVRTKLITDGPLKNKKHVELGEVVRVATPALSKHGLSISWRLSKDEPQWMEVTCTLRHQAGHSETVSMGGAPDAGPGRNAIQARGSAKTYLERYTATAILGLAPEEDDDGRSAGPLSQGEQGGEMDERTVNDYLASIEGSADQADLQKRYFQARDAATAAKDVKAVEAFANAKNKRLGQLNRQTAGAR